MTEEACFPKQRTTKFLKSLENFTYKGIPVFYGPAPTHRNLVPSEVPGVSSEIGLLL
jgi:hypothetical protein